MRRRVLSVVAVAVLTVIAGLPLTACGGSERIYIYVPDGAPLLAAAHMFYEGADIDIDGRAWNVRYVKTTGAAIGSQLARRRPPDFALAPINLAAGNSGRFVMGGVAIWGIFHIVENLNHSGGQPVTELDGLVGQTIVAFQQNLSPGIVLETVLERAGLPIHVRTATGSHMDNAVNIVYLEEPAQVVAALQGNVAALPNVRFGLLAEPVVSGLIGQPHFEIAFDMQEEWGGNFPQVAVMVRSRIAEREPDLVRAVIDMIAASIAAATDNPAETARITTNELNSTLAAPPATAFLGSDRGREAVRFVSAVDSRELVTSFLEVLYGRNPNLVGGRVPDEGFFFV